VRARLRFEVRPGVTIAAAVALGVLVALGTWQLKRLEWKQDLIARVEARISSPPIPFEEAVRRAEAGENMEYAPVALSGRMEKGRVAKVFGSYEGEAGVYVFVPVSTGDGGAVYVNEGFAPQAMRDALDGEAGEETVTGLLRYAEAPSPPASWFQTKGKSADGLWFIRDPRAFADEAGIDASPYYVDRFAIEGRDWPKGGTTRLEFSNRHFEYALTWYGLAAALIGVWVVFSLKKPD
jgi:surfeit locus 1 family protein